MNEIRGILLAAGSASRFGGKKLLHTLPGGVPVAVQSANVLMQVVPDAIAVVPPGDQQLVDILKKTGIQIVENSRAEEGMGVSLATGVQAAGDADAYIIALADMPWIKSESVLKLVEQMQQGASIVAPQYNGQRGHPVGFNAKWRDTLLGLSGDTGARDIILSRPEELVLVSTLDDGVVRDIDYPEDMGV